MLEEKKTEEQLRQEIVEEYSFEEDDERIDKILEIKKDKYTAIQQKKNERDLKEKMEKGKNFYKKEAKKATKEPKGKTQGKEPTLSVKDSARLQQAEIPVDDWDDVIEYANFKGIGISEALESSVVKATLSEKKEVRNTAKATNTGGGKRGTSKVSDEQLLANADKEKLPESDEDIARLAKARIFRKA